MAKLNVVIFSSYNFDGKFAVFQFNFLFITFYNMYVYFSLITQIKYSQSQNNMTKVIKMSQAMRKCVLCHMRTTKVQISLRIRTVWSAPLLFAA